MPTLRSHTHLQAAQANAQKPLIQTQTVRRANPSLLIPLGVFQRTDDNFYTGPSTF